MWPGAREYGRFSPFVDRQLIYTPRILLIPGTRLGAYEILSTLGAGGMGEVHRARDARLNRDVAIKVLLPSVANDPDRLARFSREAQVLASLNHPNIAHIHGLEESAGVTALVMELVEGEDLSQRIARGPIRIDEALPIARQIAEALEAAHEHGVIHRDLKPANIKVRPDGTVKVLDFGLAKAMERAGGSSVSMMNSPTLSIHATEAGIILGTAAYMSPEQARGKAVDKRADIWAFGVVLYEMLTGSNPFAGETLSDTIAFVLTREFDWSALPPNTPVGIRRLLPRALERDPKRRLRDIGDARTELDGQAPEVPEAAAAPPQRSRVSRALRIVAVFALGAAIASGLIAGWLNRMAPAGDAGSPTRFLITPRDGVSFEDEFAVNYVLSPDGHQMLLRGRDRDRGAFTWYARSMADGSIRQLVSLTGARGTPFWSPDSRSIGFFKNDSLFRVDADSTGLAVLTALGASGVAAGTGGSWSSNGQVLFVREGAVVAVSDRGGALRVVSAAQAAVPFIGTAALPDGRHVLVQQSSGTAASVTGRVLLVPIDGSSPPKPLVEGVQPMYAAPGWLLAVNQSRLLAWRLNLAEGRVEGDPVTINPVQIGRNLGNQVRFFSVSQTGTLALRPGRVDDAELTSVRWFDRAGVPGSSLKLDRHCRNPELSPAGDRVALECFDPANQQRDIWLYDLARNVASRFTVDAADDADPLWSPDGRTLVFASDRLGTVDVFQKAVGGVSEEQLVIKTVGNTPTMSWSPDGHTIALLTGAGGQSVFDFVKRTPEVPLAATNEFLEIEFQFSPDGHWFSYSSDESGRAEVYVQRWPVSGDKWRVSIDGGTDARWRPDGKELFFLSPTKALMVVPIDLAATPGIGAPTKLFDTRIAGPLGTGQRFPYAISRDGKRFLLYVTSQNSPLPAIEVTVNWPALIAKAK